jgi:hypothetical protein
MLGHEPDQEGKEFVHPFQKSSVSGAWNHDEFAIRNVFVNILQGTGRDDDIQVRSDKQRRNLNGLQFFPGDEIISDAFG